MRGHDLHMFADDGFRERSQQKLRNFRAREDASDARAK